MEDVDSKGIRLRVTVGLAAKGMSARAASLAAGMKADTLHKFLAYKTQSLRAANLNALARVLDVSPNYLLNGEEDGPAYVPDSGHGLRFGGYIEAGAFRRTDETNQEYEQRLIPLIPDPRYPAREQYAFEVVGDSMNLAGILHGMHVLGVSLPAWEHRHGELRDGLAVIVAHTINGDPRRELTVKRLRIFRDRYELQPESTNETWKPLVYNFEARHDGGDSVEIIAIAINAVKLLA